jgi:hypothetical protein
VAGWVTKEQEEHRIRESRRERQVELSQGLVRKIRKLQGLFCKTKFPVDLKLE